MFENDRVYRSTEEELRVIAAQQTLAKWRHEHRGPRYLKAGKRILYRGSDLNAWLDSLAVDPQHEG